MIDIDFSEWIVISQSKSILGKECLKGELARYKSQQWRPLLTLFEWGPYDIKTSSPHFSETAPGFSPVYLGARSSNLLPGRKRTLHSRFTSMVWLAISSSGAKVKLSACGCSPKGKKIHREFTPHHAHKKSEEVRVTVMPEICRMSGYFCWRKYR